MGMDVDYFFAAEAIKELDKLLMEQNHGEREQIADDIIEFVELMKTKYPPKE